MYGVLNASVLLSSSFLIHSFHSHANPYYYLYWLMHTSKIRAPSFRVIKVSRKSVWQLVEEIYPDLRLSFNQIWFIKYIATTVYGVI